MSNIQMRKTYKKYKSMLYNVDYSTTSCKA